jgi:nucleotide-binding universal stress UspA family protein
MSTPTRPILVGTSLTAASDAVVRNGLRIARAAGAQVHLVHAYDLTMLYSGAAFGGGIYLPEVMEAERASCLERLAHQAVRCGITAADLAGMTALEGAPYHAVVESAEALGAGLIVVGAAESWGRLSKLLGSTADRVIRAAPCPVVATRGELPMPPRRVLAAVDLSPASGDSLCCGLQVIAEMGGGPLAEVRTSIEALFVVEPQMLDALPENRAGAMAIRKAGEGLERFVRDHRPGPGWQVQGRVREAAAAEDEILGRAAEMAADLVLLGTHGRSGFRRLLIGSVAESVMRNSRGSLLVVPPAAARHSAAQAARPLASVHA